MKKMVYKLFWFIGFVFLAGVGFAKDIEIPEEYTVLHNLTQDWLVYDGGYGGYVPYLKDRHKRLKTVSFWLAGKQNAPYRLLLYAESNSYLYIQKRLAYKFDRVGWYDFSIDSLQKMYPEALLFCTLYDAQYRLPLPALAIIISKEGRDKKSASIKKATLQATQALDRTPRADDHKDWAILSILFVAVCYTALFNYNPKTFASFFSGLSSLSTLSRKDPALIQKPMNGINLAYIGVHGLLLSYFYMSWTVYEGNTVGLLQIIANQFGYCMFGWALLMGKFFGLVFLGRLFSIDRQVVNVHFFEYLRFSYLFYLVLGAVGGVVFCCYNEYNMLFFTLMPYFVLLFHVLQGLMMSFFVIKQSQFLNLYIFYYLCTTELTPWLIGVKMLLF